MGHSVISRPVIEILEQAAMLGIALRTDGDSIQFHPHEAMTRELAESIQACRSDVIASLAAAVLPPKAPCWTCRGMKFFAGIARLSWVCSTCHPPAGPGDMVWHEVAAEASDG